MKQVTWSYSALNAFETCPKRYQLTRVTKEVVEPQTEATIWGNKVHTALEHYAKQGKALPDNLQNCKRYIDKVKAKKGKLIVEERMALTKEFRPTKWMAKDVWVRGIIDLGVVGSKQALLLDWKTGKHRPDSNQLMLFAAFAFAYYPWIESVTTGFIWLKDSKFDKETFTRDQVTEIWNEFIPRVQRIEHAFDQDKWIAKPSGLCKNWCPVGRSRCEFCGV
jgi:hypothetical protein